MRNYIACKEFMISLHESYAAEMGFELATPGSAGRHSTDLTMEPGLGPG